MIAEKFKNTEGNKNYSQYFKWNISKDIYNDKCVILLIRPDLLNEAGAARDAQILGPKGKSVPGARG